MWASMKRPINKYSEDISRCRNTNKVFTVFFTMIWIYITIVNTLFQCLSQWLIKTLIFLNNILKMKCGAFLQPATWISIMWMKIQSSARKQKFQLCWSFSLIHMWIVHCEFIPEGLIVNIEKYISKSSDKEIPRKMGTSKLVSLNDNTSANQSIIEYLVKYNVITLEHSSQSLDL